MTFDFKDKNIAILGLGMEGFSSARFLIKKGAKVTVLDQKTQDEIDIHIINEVKKLGVDFVLGDEYLDVVRGFPIIVRSPGVRRNIKELIDAEKNGAMITSHTKLFFDLCPCPIIGVTGTKGKGTTSALIYEILKEDGKSAYLGGNIGKPPLDFLDKLNPQSIVVLELSSFQLQDLTCSPHIAVVLMTTSEHLDYHQDVYEYVEAKRNILRFQKKSDLAVINIDYPASRESDVHSQAQLFQVSRVGPVEKGCFVKDKKVWIKLKGKEKLVINTADILLPGEHNLENIAAAVMASLLAGATMSGIINVLKTFKGLEHRLELVSEVGGVRFYDDSFSTTPETAMAAIAAFDNPEILILGGSSKGSDFTGLGRVIRSAKNIKTIIGIGVEWSRIKKAISDKQKAISYIEGCKNMREIVRTASNAAAPGDVVLLSPACASFDMFRNYKHRGEEFKKEVNELAKK